MKTIGTVVIAAIIIYYLRDNVSEWFRVIRVRWSRG